MNPFVDPKKRSILLPPGCKDLIDVIKPLKPRTVAELVLPAELKPAFKPDRFQTAGLLHVRDYVEKLIASSAAHASLHIRSLDDWLGLTVVRSPVEFTIYPLQAAIERVENFFTDHAMRPSFDETITSDPSSAPTRILAYPLPLDVSRATELTVGLLRKVYDVDDQAGLEFLYVEVKTPWPRHIPFT